MEAAACVSSASEATPPLLAAGALFERIALPLKPHGCSSVEGLMIGRSIEALPRFPPKPPLTVRFTSEVSRPFTKLPRYRKVSATAEARPTWATVEASYRAVIESATKAGPSGHRRGCRRSGRAQYRRRSRCRSSRSRS